MTWYKVGTSHDGMERGLVVELKDTADVKRRVAKGYLSRTGEPAWSKRKQKALLSTRTEPLTSQLMEQSGISEGRNSESSDIGPKPSES